MSLLDDNILENTDISSIGFPTKNDIYYKYSRPCLNSEEVDNLKEGFEIKWINESLFKNLINKSDSGPLYSGIYAGIKIICQLMTDENIIRKHGQVYRLTLVVGKKFVSSYDSRNHWYEWNPFIFDKFFNSIIEAEEGAFMIFNRIKKNPAILNSKYYFQKNNNEFYNPTNIVHFNKFLHEYTR